MENLVDRCSAISWMPEFLRGSTIEWLLRFLLCLCIGVWIYTLFVFNFNWDEFNFLSLIYDFHRGSLRSTLQTFHVHVFQWLPERGLTEGSQIIAGRLVMACATLLNLLLIYRIGRRLLPRTGAIFAVFSYATFSYVVQHGGSFRIDPLATSLVLASVLVVTSPVLSLPHATAGGLILAIATVFTIKATMFAIVPLLLIIFLCPTWVARFRASAAFLGTYGIATLVFLVFHSLGVAKSDLYPSRNIADATSGDMLLRIAMKVVLDDGIFPRFSEFLRSFIENPTFWMLLLLGFIGLAKGKYEQFIDIRKRKILLIVFLPLLFVVFYRNAFEYFYVMIIPFASLLAAAEWVQLRKGPTWNGAGERIRRGILFACVAVPIATALIRQYEMVRNDNRAQLDLIAGVHHIFPQPVTYIDGYKVIAGFPHVGFLMSSWGIDLRRDGAIEPMRDLIARDGPPLLIVDAPPLINAMNPEIEMPPEYTLPAEDARTIRENYLPHWGMVHVAGKRLTFSPGQHSIRFEVIVGGRYRVEAHDAVQLDGAIVAPQDVVSLVAGLHELSIGPNHPKRHSAEVQLRWAAAKDPPASEAPDFLSFFALDK